MKDTSRGGAQGGRRHLAAGQPDPRAEGLAARALLRDPGTLGGHEPHALLDQRGARPCGEEE